MFVKAARAVAVTVVIGIAALGRAEVTVGEMPDFRWAGYRSGKAPLPEVKAVADVKTFGAKGDGKSDDTDAFRKAVQSVKEAGAVTVPAGRYVITDVIEMKTGVVLRGAGKGKTVLYMPKSLEEVGGGRTVEETKSGWSFSGGFVLVKGRAEGKKLTAVAGEAKRGERKLVLESAGEVKAGDWVRVVTNNHASLGRYLHGGKDPKEGVFRYKNFINWVARVEAVDGKTVTLDRPLRLDLRSEWEPAVWSYQVGIEEVGVEGITFEFLGREKRAHLKEEGFNAIYFDGADSCWVRGCEFVDADNAVNVTRARFVTVEDVTFKAAKRTSPSGHHALWARTAQDCLFRDFTFETEYVHDLSVEGFACGNVFSRGRGVAMCLDHHGDGPYENLFTDIDAGDVSRLWRSGGSADRLPHSAVRTVIWSVRYGEGKLPKLPDWPGMIVVGVKGYSKGGEGQVVEEVAPVGNLWEAQRGKSKQQ